MLRRLGNKSKLLSKLLPLFPEKVTTFIDMFMGSGAVSVAMADRCKYVIANDIDDDIFNLFMVVKERKQELIEAIESMPIHESLFKHWKQTQEHDNIWKAARFLMMSNFGYMGQPKTLRLGIANNKIISIDCIKNALNSQISIQFMSCDFRKVLAKITWRNQGEQDGAFIYADPPYLGTVNNYKQGFTLEDTRDLFELLTGSGIRFAVSEFENPIVIDMAEEHGLFITSLGEREVLKKTRRTEILITNYEPVQTQTRLFPEQNVIGMATYRQAVNA